MTQIDIFEESLASDSEQMQEEGLDLQSHEAMFSAVYEKVIKHFQGNKNSTLDAKGWYRLVKHS